MVLLKFVSWATSLFHARFCASRRKGDQVFFSSRSSLQSILDSCVNLGDDSIDRYHKSNVYYIFFKQQMLAF